jgi:hypothetical protein
MSTSPLTLQAVGAPTLRVASLRLFHLFLGACEDAEIATFYCASARLSVEQAKAELAQLEHLLIARERQLACRGAPKAQAALAEGDR